jgi:hypothetical protein
MENKKNSTPKRTLCCRDKTHFFFSEAGFSVVPDVSFLLFAIYNNVSRL